LFGDSKNKDYERKFNALISYFFKIPFPENLPYDIWMEKVRQIEWLADKGILGRQFKNGLI